MTVHLFPGADGRGSTCGGLHTASRPYLGVGLPRYALVMTREDTEIDVTACETGDQAAAAVTLDDQRITEHGLTMVSGAQAHVGSDRFPGREPAGRASTSRSFGSAGTGASKILLLPR